MADAIIMMEHGIMNRVNYAANASGLWAIIMAEAAFNVNGVYTVSRGYDMDMDMGVPSTTINYTYEVVNGLVN